MAKTFLYFAYGSNLLKQRIHINNPSAVRVGAAKLQNYKLDFVTCSKNWGGASATIIPKEGAHVWGAVWEIDSVHMESLDRQEGVSAKVYFPLTVEVKTSDGKVLECRTYRQTATFTEKPMGQLPDARKPSLVYIKTMLKGAKESKLPEEYQEFIRGISHNGYMGEVDIGNTLNLD